MSKYSKIIYNQTLTVAENSTINHVSEKEMRYYIRSRGIDRRNSQKEQYITQIKQYLIQNPMATKLGTAKALGLGINTVRKYWQISLDNGYLEPNHTKESIRKAIEHKTIEFLDTLSIDFLKEYLSNRENIQHIQQGKTSEDVIICTSKYAYFYKDTPLSNWWTSIPSIPYDGHEFTSSEAVFMYLKSKGMGDDECALEIVKADNDSSLEEKERFRRVKRLGRKCKFNEDLYIEKREEWMYEALKAKFTADKAFREVLMADKYKGLEFVEASPWDNIWGIKSRATSKVLKCGESVWKGLNLLGKLLTKIRDENVELFDSRSY